MGADVSYFPPMKLPKLAYSLALLLGLAGVTDAQLALRATLGPDQVVPPDLANGSGHAMFLLDPVANTLAYDITASVDVSPEIAAHFHNAPTGQNGPISFTLPLGTHKVGVWNYPEALEAEILGGRMYVDAHTLEGFGAIRGQILLVGVPALPPIATGVLAALALAAGVVLIRRWR